MKKNEVLEFGVNELFNNENLHQYDEDGQKGFLGYLIRNEKWEIKENRIIFPRITREEKIKELLNEYNRDVRIENLKAKREALNSVCIIGAEEYRKALDEDLKRLSKKEKDKYRER